MTGEVDAEKMVFVAGGAQVAAGATDQAVIEQDMPDLVLLDMHMHRMDGRTRLATLHKLGRSAREARQIGRHSRKQPERGRSGAK